LYQSYSINSVYDPAQYLVYELNKLIQNNIPILFDKKKCLNQCCFTIFFKSNRELTRLYINLNGWLDQLSPDL
jgi:hypothetical protein